MKKKWFFTILGLLVLIGVLGGIKGLQINKMTAIGSQFAPPPETVTTAVVRPETWEDTITAVGSLEAVQGVTVAAEMSGRVVRIAFQAGSRVQTDDLLVQLDTDSEKAQLRAAEATLELARIDWERKKKLRSRNTISEAEFDNADATYKQTRAEVERIQAIIDKKTIRAPFAGRLGIRLVNLGQILNEGDPIVSLQSMDPIYVNFLLPQQQLPRVQPDMPVRVTTDALAGQVFEGTITAINPQVDATTRNVAMQATLPNRAERLRPGMYTNVEIVLPQQQEVLAIPATAVLYAPYSDSVFVVEEKTSEQPEKVIRQQFVKLGETRGDFIAVTSGLKAGQTIVSTGAFKLRNGQSVVIDNSLAPDYELNPQPENS